MPLTNDHLIVKYKSAGLGFGQIAARLGMAEEEVQKRWESITSIVRENTSGHSDLVQTLNNLSVQYGLLGASIRIVVDQVSNQPTLAEVKDCIDPSDPEKTVQNLFKKFIILRQFIPKDPSELLLAELKG